MKHYKIHIAIVNVLILISMFFTYQVLSEYEYGWKAGKTLREGNRNISGFNIPWCYFIIGASLSITLITLIHKSVVTSIVGVIISAGLLLYIPALDFVLTFSLIGGGDDLGIGFYIGAIAVLYLLVIQIIHLVYEVKNRKETKKSNVSTDVLDDF